MRAAKIWSQAQRPTETGDGLVQAPGAEVEKAQVCMAAGGERVVDILVLLELDGGVEAVQIRGHGGGAADDVGVARLQRECVLVMSGRRRQVAVEGHRNLAEAAVRGCKIRVDRQ